jgi:hypothetical protein
MKLGNNKKKQREFLSEKNLTGLLRDREKIK